MARSPYSHSYVDTEIIDNTFVAVATDAFTTAIQVIVSDKGPDNILTYVNDANDFLTMFGTPDIRKFGQVNTNLYTWLVNGGCAYVLRVTDAYKKAIDETYNPQSTFSTLVLSVALSTEADSIEPKKKVLYAQTLESTGQKVTYVNKSLPLLPSANDLKTIVETFKTNQAATEDQKVYNVYPLLSLNSVGRSDAYNGIGFRLRLNTNFKDSYEFAVYNLTLVRKNTDGTTTDLFSPLLVSLTDQIDASGESMYIETIFNKYVQGYGTLKFYDSDDNEFHNFTGDANSVQADLMVDVAQLDIVNGSAPLNDPTFWTDAGYTKVNWNNCFDPVPNVSRKKEVVGAFTNMAPIKYNRMNPEDPTKLIANYSFLDVRTFNIYSKGGNTGPMDKVTTRNMKIAAYSGNVDPAIADTDFNPAHIIIDGNEDTEVKYAMSNLATTLRKDCICILDTKFTANANGALTYREKELNIDSVLTAIFTQDFQIYDTFSSAERKVTSTYFLASKIIQNDIEYNRGKNFVGPRRGGVSGYKSIGWYPNEAEKDRLYKSQVNYIEVTPKRVNFGSQLTSQKKLSQRSNINVNRFLLDIQRDAKEVADTYRFEDNIELTLEDLQLAISDNLQKYVSNGNAVSITVQVHASDWDKKVKQAWVDIYVVPTDILERIHITVNVIR